MSYLETNRDSAALAMNDSGSWLTSEPLSALLTRDTAALVRKYAASLQQLISADGVAVGYGSSSSMLCVASSGFGAPQLGSELRDVAAATQAMRLGRTVVRQWEQSEKSVCAAPSCIAVPAPQQEGAETSTLLIVYGPKGDTLGGSGMRMLEAAAEYLAFIITAAAPDSESQFDYLIEALDGPRAADAASPGSAVDELPYFDAPVDAPAVSEAPDSSGETLGEAAVWEQFDLLDDDCASDLSSASEASAAANRGAQKNNAAEKTGDIPVTTLDSAHDSGWRKIALTVAACVVLVLLGGLLLIGRRKGSLGRTPHQPSTTAQLQTLNAASAPMNLPAAATPIDRPKDNSRPRVDDVASLRRQALAGSAAARMHLAAKLAKSTDPALRREAYAWYIVAGEYGDATARKHAQKLNRDIPQEKIGEVREQVASAFESASGAARDLPKAYEWYLLAANSGVDVRQQLEHLRPQMPAEEVQAATATANAWLERHRTIARR